MSLNDQGSKVQVTNSVQLQTTTATLIGVVAGYAAGQHWLGLDAGAWSTVITAVVIGGPAAFNAFITRARKLKDTVGNMPKTTVVTDAETAKSLPNPDVVAVTPKIAAAINEAKGSV